MTKSKNFIQIPFEVVQKASPQGLKVYCIIKNFATMENGCFCSVDTIGKSIGVSRTQVRKYLSELEQAGFIQRYFRSGETTLYSIVTNYNYSDTTDDKKAEETKTISPKKNADHPTGKLTTPPHRKTEGDPTGKPGGSYIKFNYIKSQVKSSHTHTHDRTCTQEKKNKQSLINFKVTKKTKSKNDFPFDYDAIDSLYIAGRDIGYTMTIQEIVSFLAVIRDGGYKDKRGVFHIVRDLDSLLYQWRDNQTEETRIQAVSEAQRLKAGEKVFYTLYGETWSHQGELPEYMLE